MELLNPLYGDATLVTQAIGYSGTAGTSANIPAGVQGVTVWSDQACYVIVGEGVTATATNAQPIPANSLVPIASPTKTGNGTDAPFRVSVIQVLASGTLYIRPCNIQ